MQMVLWCALCFHSGPKQSCFIRTTSMEACRSLKKLPQGHHDPDHGHSLVQHNVTLVLCSVGRERLRQAIERHDVIVMRQLSGILGWADDSEKNCALCCLPSSRLWLLDVARSDLTCFVDSDDSWMYCSNTEIFHRWSHWEGEERRQAWNLSSCQGTCFSAVCPSVLRSLTGSGLCNWPVQCL